MIQSEKLQGVVSGYSNNPSGLYVDVNDAHDVNNRSKRKIFVPIKDLSSAVLSAYPMRSNVTVTITLT